MKDINEFINESSENECVDVVCVKDYQTKHLTFKKGEEFTARRVNSEWWCIDAIGVKEKAFKTFFKKNPSK